MSFDTSNLRRSYVLRIWPEPGSPSGWRGQLVRARSSDESVFFESLDDLVRLLSQELPPHVSPTSTDRTHLR